ncbi:MAG: DUF5689 domain-containing protein [Rikenellaceae bacterium]|jgi:hypothetical protein|nr:DUF5689 domain-containing protein [Rikenellaceae bacterium]
MKKLNFFTLASTAILLSAIVSMGGCKDKEPGYAAPTITINGGTDDVELSFGIAGEQQSVTVASNRNWTIENSASWLQTSPTGSGNGNATLQITAADNTGGTERSAVITLKVSATLMAKIVVSQDGAPKTYSPISALRALGSTDQSTTVADITLANPIKGVVISDNSSSGGNIDQYSLVVQDGVGVNSGVTFRLPSGVNNSEWTSGTEVEIDCNGADISYYGKLMQVQIKAREKITTLRTSAPIFEPVVLNGILDIRDYESQLVSFATTEVIASNLTRQYNPGTGGGTGSTIMELTNGDQYVMYCTGGASFRATNVPQGSGKIVGIAGINNSTLQISPRTLTDTQDMTGARFTVVYPTSYGTPYLSARLVKGTDAAGTKLIIPYTSGAGNVTVGVTITEAGAAGLTATPASSYALSGTGEIEVPISGTPTAANFAEVKFTVSIQGLTDNLVLDGIVRDAGLATAYGVGTVLETAITDAKLNAGDVTGKTSVTFDSGMTLSRIDPGTATFAYTATSYSVYTDSWTRADAAWQIEIPCAQDLSGTVTVKFKVFGSNTGPKNWTAQYSLVNNALWQNPTSGGTYEVTGTAVGSATEVILTITIPAGALYQKESLFIKLTPSGTTSINGATVASGGTARIVMPFTVTKTA